MQDNQPLGGAGKHLQARQLAEAALRAQAAGDDAEAERLFDQAQRTDPQAVADVLQERGTTLRADLTEPAQDDREIELMSRTVQPHSDAPSRAGISGSGSGADDEKG